MLNQLTDGYNRTHDYLRISLTDKCNLNCSYCMPDIPFYLPNHELLSDQEIVKFAELFVRDFGIQKIRLTGGEPLVRKNAAEIIESLSRLPVELAITTNGVLLDRFFSLFEKIGMKSLNISLDSLMPENFNTITKHDQFFKVFENINLGLAKGFHIKINTVIKQGMNDHEILDFIEWTRNSPVHVRFIEFMPFDGNHWHWESVVSFNQMLEKIENIYPIEKLEDSLQSTAKSFRVKNYAGTFAVISTVSEPFCQNCNRIRLTADGKMRNCLFSQNEIDLLTPFRDGKDIRPLIQNCVANKKAERGGLGGFDKKEAKATYDKGRCMTSIGG